MMDGLSDGHGFGRVKHHEEEKSVCAGVYSYGQQEKNIALPVAGTGQGTDTDGESLVPRSNYFLLGMIVFTLLMSIMVVDVKMF
ncbi:MAG: hypothetical protein VX966_04515 [Chloroflexota bacterium]|nr:hypothetical protein [Chloroflexota bacterium]